MVVPGCVNVFEVVLCFPNFLGCAGFPMFLIFLVYASLFAVVLSCGVCFGWIYVVLGCFTMFFAELFQLVLVVSTVLMLFQAVQIVYCLKSLWFVPSFYVVFKYFKVVSGGIRWFWFFEVREEMSAPSAAVLRLSAITPQQLHHPDNHAKRF